MGGGPGGVACARTSSALGAKVGLAEGDRLGGTCVNRGCVPKKFLVYASHAGEDICNSTSLGWSKEKHTFNWSHLRDGVQSELRRLNVIYEGLLVKFNVNVYKGMARFIDAKIVEVDGVTITVDRFMIETGGYTICPRFSWPGTCSCER